MNNYIAADIRERLPEREAAFYEGAFEKRKWTNSATRAFPCTVEIAASRFRAPRNDMPCLCSTLFLRSQNSVRAEERPQ
ncbi:MAG: hypothetical protein LBL66_01320 [Clostridiales bacterium]|nr:hypothetical protein [Clostridiales bacterium]